MNVIVDTPIWSKALKKKSPDKKIQHTLIELINGRRVVMLGAIRQEILSGVADARHFTQLKKKLIAFPDLKLRAEHYELAAEYHKICRGEGVSGLHTDFLICAVAALEGFAIYTTDKDFQKYTLHLDCELYCPGQVR